MGFGGDSAGTKARRQFAGSRSALSGVLALFSAVICLIAPQLRGDIVFVSDDRHVNGSVFAGAHEGSDSDSDSQTALPFSEFHGNSDLMAHWMDTKPSVPGNAPETANSYSQVMQDSTLSATQIFVHSHIDVEADGNNAGPFETVDSDALSFFQVSFSVTTPVIFNLSFLDERGYVTAEGNYQQAFDLTSKTGGSILGLPIAVIGNTSYYAGLLQPGETYTLLLSQHGNTQIPDPLGASVQNTLEVQLSIKDVPEPSVFLSLAIGLACFGIARWKLLRTTRYAMRALDLPASRVARVTRLRSRRQPPVAAAR
jgi:hypothetical protein